MNRLASILSRSTIAIVAAAGLSIVAAPTAAHAAMQDRTRVAAREHPSRVTLQAMMRRVTIDLEDQRLEDVFTFIRELSGADLEILYRDDRTGMGIDPDDRITLGVRDATLLSFVERILDRLDRDAGPLDEHTWQFTEYGTLVIGPKERLNRSRRLEIYDIQDMLLVVPDWDTAPEFSLDQVLQQQTIGGGGGGAGGTSPFQDQQRERETEPAEERARRLIEIITQFVEPDQWLDAGGDAATIRYYQGSLIVNAPDYVHRQLVGYNWWPARLTRATVQDGRRQMRFEGEREMRPERITPRGRP